MSQAEAGENGLRDGQTPQEIAVRLAAFGLVPPVEIFSGDGKKLTSIWVRSNDALS